MSQVTVAPVAGWRTIVVDSSSGTVRLPAGMSLDLGATAKAWRADRAAALASDVPATQRSIADFASRGPAQVLAGRRTRQLILCASLIGGLALGTAGLGWAYQWVTWFSQRGGDH